MLDVVPDLVLVPDAVLVPEALLVPEVVLVLGVVLEALAALDSLVEPNIVGSSEIRHILREGRKAVFDKKRAIVFISKSWFHLMMNDLKIVT